MKRPSFQFYPADWRNNAKLRRCSWEARGCWLEILCLMHDSEEYGVLRWPLKEIAQAIGAPARLVRELAEKEVIRGSDGNCPAFFYVPRHANRNGKPVELIAENQGPCWFSSRMVTDEYVRQKRGLQTRFEGPSSTPQDIPKPPMGYGAGEGSSSPSPSSSLPRSPAAPSERGLKFAEWFKTLLPETVRLTGKWKSNWAKCYDDMIRLDERTPERISAVCQWARQDSFWSSNFLSPLKLRKADSGGVPYFDVIETKMDAPPRTGVNGHAVKRPELEGVRILSPMISE